MARLGIKARLGLVAVAPALAVVVGAGSIAAEKATDRAAMVQLRAAARHLDADVQLHAALHGEQALAQLLARLPTFGVSPRIAGEFLQRDIAGDLQARQAEVDRLLDRVPPAIGASVAPLVAQARQALPSAAGDVTRIGDPYDRAAALAGEAVRAQLVVVRARASSLRGTGRILAAVDATRRANSLSQNGVLQAGQLASLAFADEGERNQHLVAVTATHALYRSAADFLREAGGPAGEALARLEADPEVAQYLAALHDIAVVGDPEAIPDRRNVLALTDTFRGTLDFQDLVPDIISGATGSLLEAADDAERAAGVALRNALVVLTSVLLGTVLVAAANAVSLARSLRRLADDVRTVQAGDLDHRVATGSTTTEVGVLQDAVVDLVANLRTVDRQAQALADGRLDAPVLDEQVPGTLGLALRGSVDRLSDVLGEERALRERLAHAATHDSLTGLMNRLGVLQHIDRELAAGTRAGRGTALLFIDLDDFKRVNDHHGHAAGDLVLREVAARLQFAGRAGDVLARLGGDEFLAVLPDVTDAAAAVAMGERLLAAACRPIEAEGESFVVGASVGVALACDGRLDAMELLEQADVAVFRAKTRGKGRVELFDAELQRQITERDEIERALTGAVTNGELVVHYQPIVAGEGLTPVALEALVRWQRPGSGLVPPGAFIPVAESSDLIVAIGRQVLRVATAELARGPLGAAVELDVTVNVSARHVASGSLLDDVRDALTASGLAPHRLVVEITETVLVTDLPFLAEQLEQLRALGVRVAIDDFGTGFTSLAHLRQLPVDVIKIDRSFVADMADDDGSLVRLVADLGHHLGLEVVAEGVETDEQLAMVRHAGCDRVQGYLVGRPVPADELDLWYVGHRARIDVAIGSPGVA